MTTSGPAGSVDVLSDVLRAVHLRGTVYFHADFAAPWGMSLARGEVANFHMVTEGRCWVGGEGLTGHVALNAGDLVVFPGGGRHTLADGPESATLPAKDFMAGGRTGPDGRTVVFGGGGDVSKVICGHFQHDRQVPHPLFASLPAAIVVRSGEGPEQWLDTALRLAVLESQSPTMGSPAVTDRLAEVLFIQVLRTYLRREPTASGFLAALADRQLGRVIQAIHEHPERPWTLAGLAQVATCSRTALATRFKSLTGVSPIRYLIEWRMALARDLLISTDLTLAAIAERSGYRSEFSFSKAFKRIYGEPPGSFRRARPAVAV